ncbi:hypothetical protein [Bacillus sp. T3]|nr:hypothetical protein [Bacillus sp. T3]
MAYLWVLTFGFVLCLGMAGGTLFYFIRSSLDTRDANKIDLIDSPKKQEK